MNNRTRPLFLASCAACDSHTDCCCEVVLAAHAKAAGNGAMETIAASGTRLNLDYAIDEWLDEYDQEDIIEYFKSCQTSSLDVARQELSDNDYSWEQLKIMRIKFLSVYGN